MSDEDIEAVKDAAYDRGDMRLVRLCLVAENESGDLRESAIEKIAAVLTRGAS